MNLSVFFARSVNGSLDSLFATPPRKALKNHRLMVSQARRWKQLSPETKVNQICDGWGISPDSEQFTKIIGSLTVWACQFK